MAARPVAVNKRVKAPQWLSAAAAKVWPGILKQVQSIGVVEQVDAQALALYCESFVRWKDASDLIVEHGTVIKSPSGYPMQSPYLAIANRAHEQMMRLLVEFCMTPRARSAKTKNAGKKDDQKEAAAVAARGRFAPMAPPRLVANNNR